MICDIYSVKDELNGTYMNPIFIQNSEVSEQEATRIFKSQINNTQVWRDNPQDFTLYYLGAFDIKSGMIQNERKEILNGKSVKE